MWMAGRRTKVINTLSYVETKSNITMNNSSTDYNQKIQMVNEFVLAADILWRIAKKRQKRLPLETKNTLQIRKWESRFYWDSS